MKIRGEFIIRRITDNIVAIPVGDAALKFNGMLLLNEVSKVIWDCLERECDLPGIVAAVTDAFDVSAEEAEADIIEFLQKLRLAHLLEE